MTDITELTVEKLEEIRQRYRPTEVPKCHILIRSEINT